MRDRTLLRPSRHCFDSALTLAVYSTYLCRIVLRGLCSLGMGDFETTGPRPRGVSLAPLQPVVCRGLWWDVCSLGGDEETSVVVVNDTEEDKDTFAS